MKNRVYVPLRHYDLIFASNEAFHEAVADVGAVENDFRRIRVLLSRVLRARVSEDVRD